MMEVLVLVCFTSASHPRLLLFMLVYASTCVSHTTPFIAHPYHLHNIPDVSPHQLLYPCIVVGNLRILARMLEVSFSSTNLDEIKLK